VSLRGLAGSNPAPGAKQIKSWFWDLWFCRKWCRSFIINKWNWENSTIIYLSMLL